MGNERYLALEKVEFYGYQYNSFDSEEEAIQTLIENKKTWQDYVILKQVFII